VLSLLGFLYDRTHGRNCVAFFSNDGVLPSKVILGSPIADQTWSVMFAFGSPTAVTLAMSVIYLIYIAYIVGWHTHLMQWLVVVILVSLDNRNLLLESGGVVVTIIAAVFTAFLPLGDRFSIDALRRPRHDDNRVVRLAYGFLIRDFAAIYAFNSLQKSGTAWKDGSAIHWVLWQNRVATSLAGWVRMHEPIWFSPLLTYGTIAIEATLALLLLMPVMQRWCRRRAILLIIVFHGGIALLMVLGPFSYTMTYISLLLVGTEDWDALKILLVPRFGKTVAAGQAWLETTLCMRHTGIHAPVSPWPRATSGLREVASTAVAAAALVQLLHQNWILPPLVRVTTRPMLAAYLADYLRMGQGWMMFAPDVPVDDGSIVVDGLLSNGNHVDPFTGQAPDFDQALHGPLGYGEPWCLYFVRISDAANRRYWRSLRDYVAKMHALPNAKVHEPMRTFDVYWVSNRAPSMGSHQPYDIQRRLLFSGR
jgi:hypothetical protein